MEDVGAGEGRKDAPYIMPPSHGEISTPFYDLPAGNLMPCIVPNSLNPIDPQAVKPVPLRAGPADEKLIRVVQAFLQDAGSIYGAKRPDNVIGTADIDELGQPIPPSDQPRGTSAGEGYYGWSKAFCEKIRLRNDERPIADSPFPDYQANLESRRKRRYSSSDSSRSRSGSRPASRSPFSEGETGRMRRGSNGSGSRSISHSRLQRSNQSRDPKVAVWARSESSRSKTRSYSPPDVATSEDRPAGDEQSLISAPPNDGLRRGALPPPAFLQQGFFSPGQIPIPPPPPANYRGPWVSGPHFSSRFQLQDRLGDGDVLDIV